jgi:hypothetical protein
MLSSCTRSDINSTYALFSYYALLTHRQNNSLRGVQVILIIVSTLVILADIWAIALLKEEQVSDGNRVFGYIWIILEIGLKAALVIMLSLWLKHTSQADQEGKGRSWAGDNSLVEEN